MAQDKPPRPSAWTVLLLVLSAGFLVVAAVLLLTV
jgi:hypothetical protein